MKKDENFKPRMGLQSVPVHDEDARNTNALVSHQTLVDQYAENTKIFFKTGLLFTSTFDWFPLKSIICRSVGADKY